MMKMLNLNKTSSLCLVMMIVPSVVIADTSKTNLSGTVDYIKEHTENAPDAVGTFEGTQVFIASDFLPAAVLSGSHHVIDQNVFNDGYMNRYTISSSYGKMSVVSTAKLHKRVHEINVIAEIEKIEKDEEFVEGIVEKGEDVLDGVEQIITSPIDTLSNTISGVGKLFQRAGENLTEQARSDQESRLAAVSGFSKTKRDYAKELNVDVYSRNTILQDKLEDLTEAGYAGNLLAAVTIGALTGPVTSASGVTELMDKVIADTAPPDLRKMNREKLEQMGVVEATADEFIANGSYSPREQTILVNALSEMNTTLGREQFIEAAMDADHYDVTYFRQVQAEMYAQHNRDITPLKTFIGLGPFVAAVTDDNAVVLTLPMDYMLWTEAMATAMQSLNEYVNGLFWVEKKKLYFTGSVSPLARKNIINYGWEIIDNTSAL
jgi:hypothetical protein